MSFVRLFQIFSVIDVKDKLLITVESAKYRFHIAKQATRRVLPEYKDSTDFWRVSL